MAATRAAAKPPFGLRQDGQPPKPSRLANEQHAAAVDREMIDDMPEKRRRFGVALVRAAENERGSFVKQTVAGEPHPEIGDHMAEMLAGRSAPDAPVRALDGLRGRVRPGIDRGRYSPPAMAGIDLRLEIWPFRAAAKKRAGGMPQHLLRRVDHDLRERFRLVVQEGKYAHRARGLQQPPKPRGFPRTAHRSRKTPRWPCNRLRRQRSEGRLRLIHKIAAHP